MTNYLKCNTCTNARPIISENDYHYTCMLSDRKGEDCLMNEYKHWETMITRNLITFSKDAKISGSLPNRIDIGDTTFVVTPDKIIKIGSLEYNEDHNE